MRLTLVLLISLLFLSGTLDAKPKSIPETVESVDLERYTGLWYEYARIPNPFQKKCQSNTTAEYNLLADGNIEVINRCRKENGKMLDAVGIAKVEDSVSFSKLKVSFVTFLGANLFWGDYWIIGLDTDYKWAIVGDPKTKYGWILSRTVSLDDKTLDTINSIIIKNGYNPKDFITTGHED